MLFGFGVGVGEGACWADCLEGNVKCEFCFTLFFPESFPGEETPLVAEPLPVEFREEEIGVNGVASLVEVIQPLLDIPFISSVGKALLLCSMLIASSTKGAGLKYSL